MTRPPSAYTEHARGLTSLVLRCVLGVVFLYAGVAKLLPPTEGFADSIASFRLLPAVAIGPFALAVPPFELLLGLILLAGRPRRLGAFAALSLSVLFLLALSFALVRGIQVDCGCFGTGPALLRLTATQRIWLDVLRDTVLTVMALTLYRLDLLARSTTPTP